MSRTCDVCGKGSMHGNKVSKSYNHTRRSWRPNLLKIKTELFGTTRTINICTQCLRSGFVTKKINVTPANAGAKKD
ncbi:MAG: 50S ribosomal protein L28 [Treponema sp.]|nr:50S ribosomal protein L28 [Spirochaetia bacterium]MDD7580373.1 50S ribosomal protein L28 [Treponema sp.]MCI7441430.1 50S ribosomal protein L28 [Spirochaetia bacterium]MDY3759328.1 50S ribosomal protein L28 [Treponema sp.]MDY4130677.1 50S ribosomal protein L28 [Treponema sp.]